MNSSKVPIIGTYNTMNNIKGYNNLYHKTYNYMPRLYTGRYPVIINGKKYFVHHRGVKPYSDIPYPINPSRRIELYTKHTLPQQNVRYHNL